MTIGQTAAARQVIFPLPKPLVAMHNARPATEDGNFLRQGVKNLLSKVLTERKRAV